MGRQGKLVGHIHSLHDHIRPRPIHIIQLIYLGPAPNPSRLRCITDWAVKEMRYRPRVGRGVPLNFDFVTGFGSAHGFAARDGISVYVAGYII